MASRHYQSQSITSVHHLCLCGSSCTLLRWSRGQCPPPEPGRGSRKVGCTASVTTRHDEPTRSGEGFGLAASSCCWWWWHLETRRCYSVAIVNACTGCFASWSGDGSRPEDRSNARCQRACRSAGHDRRPNGVGRRKWGPRVFDSLRRPSSVQSGSLC